MKKYFGPIVKWLLRIHGMDEVGVRFPIGPQKLIVSIVFVIIELHQLS